MNCNLSQQNQAIRWTEAGTPISTQFDDVYFSKDDGLAESRYVFFAQNDVASLWQQHHAPHFTIAETGFGTGLNFLMTWHAWMTQPKHASLQRLYFISFEKYPLSQEVLRQAHACWPELAPYADALQAVYQAKAQGCHRFVFADGQVVLDLWVGDVNTSLPEVPTQNQVHVWYLDGFAPAKNPQMWQPCLFSEMARLSVPGTRFATFYCSRYDPPWFDGSGVPS